MKLKTLAIAIAVASIPFAAQAEVTIGGDVTVRYLNDGNGYNGTTDLDADGNIGDNSESFNTSGSEVIFNASEKVGGLTFGGTATANIGSGGGNVTGDDVNVYVSGGFGKVTLGDTDNGCDAVDTGWVASDNFISHSSGGCTGIDQHHITYTRSMGAATVAASYSPDSSADMFAVGIKGKLGPVAVSLGYEDGDGVTGGSNVVLGVSGALGPVSLGVRANQYDGMDTNVGYTANYSAGGNTIYGGIGDVDGNDTQFLGYSRKIGSKTKAVLEWVGDDSLTDDKIAAGLIHSF